MITLKPWGSEELLVKTDRYVMKKLHVKAHHSTSLQYHEYKDEAIYVLSGEMLFLVGDTQDNLANFILCPGAVYHLPPKKIHRVIGVTDCTYLEASTTELDDVVRLADAYGRV